MRKQPYLPRTDKGKVVWMINFAVKKEMHARLFGFTAEEVLATKRDSEMFSYVVALLERNKKDIQEVTAYKNILRDGPKSSPTLSFPTITRPDKMPQIVPAAIFERVSRDVDRIKAHNNYTNAIGQDFGVIGAASNFDPSSFKTRVRGTSFATHVELKFLKKGADGVNFYKRIRGNSQWEFLAKTIKSPFKDITKLQQEGVPEVREYMAIGFKGNDEIGQPSNIVSVVYAGPQ